MLTIQSTPYLSLSIPKLSPQGACSSGARMVAPSESPSHQPRSVASSSPLMLTCWVRGSPGTWEG
ncbi:hypothetical protein ASE01_05230 [Nocardioides sp. Root190]|nr:hypothetical protein ASE01_05230 [Nocardioides sp. Root190]